MSPISAKDDFNEEKLIQLPAVQLFSDIGWETVDGRDEFNKGPSYLGRETANEVLLASRLEPAIKKLNPRLNSESIKLAVEELSLDRSRMSPANASREVYQLLKDGVKVTYRDDSGEDTTDTVKLIDWNNPSNNNYLLVSEFWVMGEMYKRRADLVGFVNGIPLVFIELKAVHKSIRNAFDSNLKDYKVTVPQLFWTNGFIILSNGGDARIGGVTSSWKHFRQWKRINNEGEQGVVSLETMLRGVCEPSRLLDLIENFIIYQETRDGLVKIVAKNHQYLGVNKVVDELIKLRGATDPVSSIDLKRSENQPEGSGRLGVFWHTPGSGKSVSMIYFAQKVFRKLAGNWTFVIVTDRRELDVQIYENFADARVITESQAQAESAEDLKRLLQEDHRYVFTLIQKFRTERGQVYPKISDRSDIIVVTDEAHRSQYDTFALNMRSALPNACFIGFTGTPLMVGEEKTRQVFGDYVSVYDFKQSVEDGNTVPLYYEKRLPELQLTNEDLNEDIYKAIEEANLDEDQEKKLEHEFARQYHLITSEDRLELVAEDLVNHFMGRDFSTSAGPGKAMVVCIDKVTAVKMYDKVSKYWDIQIKKFESYLQTVPSDPESEFERKLKFLKETELAVVVSQAQNEIEDMKNKGVDMTPHRKKMVTQDLDKRFKDPDDKFRIVFVCAMWMTGFDVPCCSTIYLDKPMRNHSLIQTIDRANRVFPQKNNGLIVDYIGVFRNLQRALAIYSPSDGSDVTPIQDKKELIKALLSAIEETKTFCSSYKIDLDAILKTENWITVKGIEDAVRGIVLKEPDQYSGPLDDTVEKILINDVSKQKYKELAGNVKRIFKAIKPDPMVKEVTPICTLIIIIAVKIQSLSGTVDISEVMDDVGEILDDSIRVGSIKTGPSQVVDLSKLDIEKLREKFKTEHKHTEVEKLKGAINSKIKQMVRLNKLRMDFFDKFQKLIEDYNNGGVDLPTLFDELIKLISELQHEEKRSFRENLSEEELAVFDLLTKPDIRLSQEEKQLVKKVVKDLIDKLKREKLVIDWRKKQQTRADVRLTIEKILDKLPQVYTKDLYDEKCYQTYQHIYEHYYGQGMSVYGMVA